MLALEAVFNSFEFNDPGVGYSWELVLNPGVGEVVVASGTGAGVLPEVMIPGQRYQLRTTLNGYVAALNIFSPNAVGYDDLGG
jgi:hypothetical protein